MSFVAAVADDDSTPVSVMYATRLVDPPRLTEMLGVCPRSTEILAF